MIALAVALLATSEVGHGIFNDTRTLHVFAYTCAASRCHPFDKGVTPILLDKSRSGLPPSSGRFERPSWSIVFDCAVRGDRFTDCRVATVPMGGRADDIDYAFHLARQIRTASTSTVADPRARLGISYDQIGCPITACDDVPTPPPPPKR